VCKGHGRITRYHLEVARRPVAWFSWPALHQVFKLTRTTIDPRTGEFTGSTVYGLTSLSAQRASPDDLLALVRQHWTIENKVHWIRDVIFDEDHSQLRSGSRPHLMALLRNLALSLLRFADYHAITPALRLFAARPAHALALCATSFGQ
jgi:predicted transposase YbfD/YdcC